MVKTKCFLPEIGNKARMSVLTTLTQDNAECSTTAVWQEKEIKAIQNRNE